MKNALIDRLKEWKYREAQIRSSVNTNLPSQIRALRLRRLLTQGSLAEAAHMRQPRISAIETPGATNFNVQTLVRVAAALKVGLVIKFVPISEMLRWDDAFSQDHFNVVTFDSDRGLLHPSSASGMIASESFHWVSIAPRPILGLPAQPQELVMTNPPPIDGGVVSSTATSMQFTSL